MTSELLDQALVEEATKKSGLIWVKGPGVPARTLWHVWHEGAACVVGDGPGEQPLPGLADGAVAEVTVRSKDKGGRLVSWAAKVVELTPGTEQWEATVAELKGKRLNARTVRRCRSGGRGNAGCSAWSRRARRRPCRTARWPRRRCRLRRRPGSRSPLGCRGCC